MVHFQPCPTIFVSEYGSKCTIMHRKYQNFLRPAARTMRAAGTIFVPQTFEVKVTPLQQKHVPLTAAYPVQNYHFPWYYFAPASNIIRD